MMGTDTRKAALILAALLIVCCGWSASAGGDDGRLVGRVILVVDGDTLDIREPDRTRHRIRLYGINAPEIDAPGGPEAKAALLELVARQTITVHVTGRDRWGRVLGIVEGVQEALLAAGHADIDWRYCTRPICITWKNLD